MKIKTLTLNNFRAFPGPESQTFTLDGKNLLVYGENGSGKSSVFHALKTFFGLSQSGNVGETCNVFSRDTDTWNASEHWIEVEFDDNTPAVRWSGQPPMASWPTDQRVMQATIRQGCLDYRALLDTNYRHLEEEINLFDVALKHLLTDFKPVGSSDTIGELWAEMVAVFPNSNKAYDIKPAQEACDLFNGVFGAGITSLFPIINSLLPKLAADGVKLDQLIFGRVGYDKATRSYIGRLIPKISLHSEAIVRPHDFLNEARLSAIGLAMYLAGRLLVPTDSTYVPPQEPPLKLLVLDDVLIGLDLSNRLPLLDLLREYFSEWQIVLLTHDKNWFDMAKDHVEDNESWAAIKMYEGARNGSYPVPIVVQMNQSAREIALSKASEFLQEGEYQAAANYARSAFEGTLKNFCEKRSVPVKFAMQLKTLDSDDFLKAMSYWIQGDNRRVFYEAALERTKLFRRIILNPLSHADAPAVKYEVKGAIAAVKKLNDALGQPLPQHAKLLETVRETATNPLPANQDEADFELQIALANLRAKFAWSLRKFCERHQVNIPFTVEPPNVSSLWRYVTAEGPLLFTNSHAGLETLINAEREWLIEEIDRANLQILTQSDLLRLVGLLNPSSNENIVLDVI